jgi:hypothetical protein
MNAATCVEDIPPMEYLNRFSKPVKLSITWSTTHHRVRGANASDVGKRRQTHQNCGFEHAVKPAIEAIEPVHAVERTHKG